MLTPMRIMTTSKIQVRAAREREKRHFSRKLATGSSMIAIKKAKASGINSSCPNLAMYISRIRDKRVKASLALKGSFTSFMGWFCNIFIKEGKKEQ